MSLDPIRDELGTVPVVATLLFMGIYAENL